MHRLSLVCTGCFARAYRPHRLIRDHQGRVDRHQIQDRFQLRHDSRDVITRFALFQGFPYTYDRYQSRGYRG